MTTTAAPGRPQELTRRAVNLIFVTILLGILVSALDQTVVSTALPTIVGDLGGAGHVSWVATSYILTDTIATVLAGKLGDVFGRKWVFQVSMVIFIVGSALSGLAGSMTTLIAWRALQGSTDGPGSSNDQGMDVQTGLEYLHTTGGPDGVKAVAFAKVDHTNLDEVKAALAIFGALWLGVQVLDANQKEFSEGRAWTDVAGSAIDGGHAILGGGYTSADIKFTTWAKETEFARSFWHGVVQGTPLVEEAWVVIWPEHLGTTAFEQGVDQAQLTADYHALTGNQLVLSQ
jgi:MFS family permease